MSRGKQTDLERELVKLAMAFLIEDWPQTQKNPPTAANISEGVWNRRESTNVSRYIRHGELPKEVRAVRKFSMRAAALLQQWIPALDPRSSLDDLSTPLALALAELGIPEHEIEHARASNAPHWPGAYRRTPRAEPLSRFIVDLIELRRLSDGGRGPIDLALSQSWYVALSLVEAAAAQPRLISITPTVWEAIFRAYVPSLDKALLFGEPEDARESDRRRLSDDERTLHYHALQDSVAAVTSRGESPTWTPLRLREEFRMARASIHSHATLVGAIEHL